MRTWEISQPGVCGPFQQANSTSVFWNWRQFSWPGNASIFFAKEPDCPFSHRQHHGCCLHKQGRGYKIRFTLSPALETSVMVQPEEHHPTDSPYPRMIEHDYRPSLSSQSNYLYRMVSPTKGYSTRFAKSGTHPRSIHLPPDLTGNWLCVSPAPDKEVWECTL